MGCVSSTSESSEPEGLVTVGAGASQSPIFQLQLTIQLISTPVTVDIRDKHLRYILLLYHFKISTRKIVIYLDFIQEKM